MSLKLDELRKRLLQQQAGSDNQATDTPPSMSGGRIAGAVTQKGPEIAPALKTVEPLALVKTKVAAKTGEVLIYAKTRPAEPAVEGAPEAPAESAEPAQTVESAGASSVSLPVTETRTDAPDTPPAAPPPTPAAAIGQNELVDAVGKVFEQTKGLQTRLEDLNRIFDPIDRVGNSAARAFAPLRGFQKQMAQLAQSFEPMRAFQAQLSQMAQTFEPMKGLEDQLSRLADSFQSHLADLIKALEPAKQLRERIQHLGAAFDEATELQAQFSELYQAFELSPGTKENHLNGLDAHANLGR